MSIALVTSTLLASIAPASISQNEDNSVGLLTDNSSPSSSYIQEFVLAGNSTTITTAIASVTGTGIETATGLETATATGTESASLVDSSTAAAANGARALKAAAILPVFAALL